MRNRFAVSLPPPPPPPSPLLSPLKAPPAFLLEQQDFSSLQQQHMVAFCVLLGCAIIFICVLSITEREKKEEP